MIKFFRKIRQKLLSENKFSKYLIYAIGEIFLVVIGILIALSINNWNEGVKNDQKESLLIKNVIEDLNSDSVHIHKSLNELEDQLRVVDNLIAKALDSEIVINADSTGLVRYSSDFRPISQRNHTESVSNLNNEFARELIQNYFLKEDDVMDIFKEYENIIHNKVRPYLSDVGMHNLKSLYIYQTDEMVQFLLQPDVLEEQLGNVKFQQLLFERRLKTDSFKRLMTELLMKRQELIEKLKIEYR